MKHIFLLILLINSYGFSQTIEIGDEWKTMGYYLTQQGSTPVSYIHKLGADTMINTIQYKKLQTNYGNGFFTTGGLRTLGSKVYFYSSTYMVDTLLFDFSLNEGDTVNTFLTYPLSPVVSKIDTVTVLDGTNRRRFWLKPTVTDSSWVVEGFFTQAGLIESLVQYDHVVELLCYTTIASDIYLNNSLNDCSDFALGQKVLTNPDSFFSVQNGNLIIHSEANDNIEIYNLEGKLILESEKKSHINIHHLAKGIYILKAKSNNQVLVKKFLVQ